MAQNPLWRDDWLAQVQEEVIDPARPLVDPHHHLFPPGYIYSYDLPDLLADLASGHRVEQTVFLECGGGYRSEGPDALKPVGETEFAAASAERAARGPAGTPRIGAIVGNVDLRLGDRVAAVLEAHLEAGRGLFRGVRDLACWEDTGSTRALVRTNAPHYYLRPDVRVGMARLIPFDLVCDLCIYHPQFPEVIDLVRALPEVRFVLNHYGRPLGVGPYAGRRSEIFAEWAANCVSLAGCPNVFMKVGGLALENAGFGFHEQPRPPTSEEMAAAWRPYFEHTVECFGAARCMFESNFPADKMATSYRVLWNAFKRLASDLSGSEKDALFRTTATTVYRLAPND